MLQAGVETRTSAFGYAHQCGLHVLHRGVLRPRLHPVFPAVSGAMRFGIHNNSLNNGVRALVERVFLSPQGGVLVPPPPCTVDVDLAMKGFATKLARCVGVHRPISKEQFLEYYSGRRRDCYARAVASLESSPITRGDFGVKKAFVKAEKINFSSKPDPPPRVIQPRDPRYNVEVGVYLRPLEHDLYRGVAQVYGGPTVMKGYNAEGVAQELRSMWDDFASPVAVGLDASRFDQHVRPELLKWEHNVYLRCFSKHDRRKLAWLLSGQIDNKCYLQAGDGRVKYRVKGSRMSGDMNTALGNCLIMCAMVWTLAKERNVRIRLANNGDDCVVIMEARDVERFRDGLEQWFLNYGFRMKVEDTVRDFERIVFCQSSPVHDGVAYTMMRDPRTTLSKDACCVVKDYGWGPSARTWLHAVGECGLRMTGGLPVAQDHYKVFLRHGTPGKKAITSVQETGMAMLARGCARGYKEPTMAARESFYMAFGILPSAQEHYEDLLRKVEFPIPDSPCIGLPGAPYGLLPWL